MATKLMTNVLKRSKDVLRWAVKSKTAQTQKQVEVRQPVSDLVRLQSQIAAPIRTRIFRSGVTYQTLASQLRRRAALNFGRSTPLFAFVGIALVNAQQDDEHDSLSSEIRDTLQRSIKTSPIIQKLSLEYFDLGQVIGKGCNAVVYEAKVKETDLPREATLHTINEDSSDYESISKIPETVDANADAGDIWIPPQESISSIPETVDDDAEDKWIPPQENEIDTSDHMMETEELCDHVVIAEETTDHVTLVEEERSDSFCIIGEIEDEISDDGFRCPEAYENFGIVLMSQDNGRKTSDSSFSSLGSEIYDTSLQSSCISFSSFETEAEPESTLRECSWIIENNDESKELSFCLLENSYGETSLASLNSSLDESKSSLTEKMSLTSFSYSLAESESSFSEDESDCDQWFCPGLNENEVDGSLDDENSTKYDLAIKMMYNYGVESRSESIMKAMEKETVPARIPIYQGGEDTWFSRNRAKLKSLPQHPNVVDMIGAFVDPFHVPEISVAMEICPAALPKRLSPDGHGRNMTMYIVMKKYNMTLRQYLEQHDPDMQTRCLLLAQLLEGIVHLGNHKIAHRDIKSDNLFLEFSEDAVPHLVIGDFGCCLADEEYGQKIPYQTNEVDRGGNCSLMAPEISTACPGRNVVLDFSKADLWAVGTIIYEIFSMENPFYGNSNEEPTVDSRTYRESDLPSLPDSVPEVVRLLARMCLSRDPSQRPSPIDAANIMQLYLWFPEFLNTVHTVTEIKDQLLILTARLILLGQAVEKMEVHDQLKWTFLKRLQIKDLLKFYE